MFDPDDLFAEFNGDPAAVRAEFNHGSTQPTAMHRLPCHFAKAFKQDGKWCEDRWGKSTQYYCGPCRQHNHVRD